MELFSMVQTISKEIISNESERPLLYTFYNDHKWQQGEHQYNLRLEMIAIAKLISKFSNLRFYKIRITSKGYFQQYEDAIVVLVIRLGDSCIAIQEMIKRLKKSKAIILICMYHPDVEFCLNQNQLFYQDFHKHFKTYNFDKEIDTSILSLDECVNEVRLVCKRYN